MEFSQLAVLLGVAAVFGVIAKKLKQPLLIGYLFAGFFLMLFGVIKDKSLIDNLGKIGITLLLFLVGLEMDLSELPTVGKTALLTGLIQIVFTFSSGFVLGMILGLSVIPAIYLGIAVSFSSTIIIVKLLSEKNALGSLYGKISVGFLLVQDLVAIIILMVLSGFTIGDASIGKMVWMMVKGFLLLMFTFFLSKKVLPYIFSKHVDVSSELIFIVSIAWAIGVAAIVAGPLGFTLEIGGFIAGIALSNLPDHTQIASRTKPLRDFFLTLFFLSLGTSLVISNFGSIIFPSIAFSLLVLIGNPLIVMAVMGFLRFKKRTSFLASVTVAQISEFSLVVVAMGKTLGQVDDSVVAISVMVAAITMTVSTYLILQAENIYPKLKSYLGIFERKITSEIPVTELADLKDHIILVGCYRTGRTLLPLLKSIKLPFVIVDFNPNVYKKLVAENYDVVFGDIADTEIMSVVKLDDARAVISTINNLQDNYKIIERLKSKKVQTIFTANTRNDALRLYEKGASYVIVPEIVAGEHIKHMIRTYGVGTEKLDTIGKKHFNRLIFT